MLLIIISVLSGCAGSGLVTEKAQKINYWPKGGSSDPWVVSGTFHQTAAHVVITIDGFEVINDHVSLISGGGTFQGMYKDLPVRATCVYSWGNGKETCEVYIDGRFSAYLTFDGAGILR